MQYLKNTILNYDRVIFDNYSIPDYLSKKLPNILDFIDSLDSNYFSWYQVQDNDKLERISHEIYGNENYWDILLLINRKLPLVNIAHDYDTLYNIAEDMVQDYENSIFNVALPSIEREILLNKFLADLLQKNEEYRIIRIVNPSKMNKFLQLGFEAGYF